jgi:hypothetical protein
VAEQARQREDREVQERDRPLGVDDARQQHERGHHGDDGEQAREPLRGHEPPARERDDEGAEVDAEREHPEQRDRRDLAGEILRDTEEERRGHRCARDPEEPVASAHLALAVPDGGGWRGGRVGGGHAGASSDPFRRRFAPPATRRDHDQRTRRRKRHHHEVAERPQARLAGEREEWLEREREDEEPQQATRVRACVEEVRIRRVRVLGGGEPPLQERAGGGEHHERQPHRAGQRGEHPPGLTASRLRCAAPERDGQHEQREREHHQVQDRLPADAEPAHAQVRVQVPHEQRGLEEDERGVPHLRAPSGPGEHHLPDHRLDEEEQRGRHEDGDREERRDQDSTRRSRTSSRPGAPQSATRALAP